MAQIGRQGSIRGALLAAAAERERLEGLRRGHRPLLVLPMLTLLLLASLALTFGPHMLGVTLANASGRSMEPGIRAGDTLIIRPAAAQNVETGDVVLYLREGLPILHRVVGRGVDGGGTPYIVTQGDNNAAADEPIAASKVRGELVGRVPLAGSLSRAVGFDGGYHVMWMAILASTALITLALAAPSLGGLRRRRPAASGASRERGVAPG